MIHLSGKQIVPQGDTESTPLYKLRNEVDEAWENLKWKFETSVTLRGLVYLKSASELLAENQAADVSFVLKSLLK